MLKLFRWTGAALAALVVFAAPARASFLQELGSPFATGAATVGLYSADFNRDGYPDLVSLNNGAANATALLRRASGGFASDATVALPAEPQLGAIADFNRDGWPDFAATSYTGAATSVYLRDPAGGFAPAPGSPVTTGKATAVAPADFNGDGRIDMAVALYDANTVQVLRQRVDGSYSAEGAPIPVGQQPRSLALGDFNGDGRPDLAVSNATSGTVSVLICQPDGSLREAAGSPIKVGASTWMVVTTDLNGDGHLDLAVTGYPSATVDLLAGTGNGGFTPMPGSPLAVPGGPVGIATADFNRDGRVDLAVGSYMTSVLNVLLRQADGSYAPDPSSPVPIGTNPYGIVADDFNRDGKPDLATGNATSANVTVLINTTPDPVPPPSPPAPPPTPAPTTPSISPRLVLSWNVSKSAVKITAASLRDVPVGSRVRIYCKPCKVSQTLTTKKSTTTLSKLRNKRLKRKATFTITVTHPAYNGVTLTRKVKNYGRTRAALRKAVRAPFIAGKRCLPVPPGARC